jgi:hypothetical protein
MVWYTAKQCAFLYELCVKHGSTAKCWEKISQGLISCNTFFCIHINLYVMEIGIYIRAC